MDHSVSARRDVKPQSEGWGMGGVASQPFSKRSSGVYMLGTTLRRVEQRQVTSKLTL